MVNVAEFERMLEDHDLHADVQGVDDSLAVVTEDDIVAVTVWDGETAVFEGRFYYHEVPGVFNYICVLVASGAIG
jgi:hypothetical protein